MSSNKRARTTELKDNLLNTLQLTVKSPDGTQEALITVSKSTSSKFVVHVHDPSNPMISFLSKFDKCQMAIHLLPVFLRHLVKSAETNNVGKSFGSIPDYEFLYNTKQQHKDTIPSILHNFLGTSYHHDQTEQDIATQTTLPTPDLLPCAQTPQEATAQAKKRHAEVRPEEVFGSVSQWFEKLYIYATYPGTLFSWMPMTQPVCDDIATLFAQPYIQN